MDYRGFARNELPRRTPGQRRFQRLSRRSRRCRTGMKKVPKRNPDGSYTVTRWTMTLQEWAGWRNWYDRFGKKGAYAPSRRVSYRG